MNEIKKIQILEACKSLLLFYRSLLSEKEISFLDGVKDHIEDFQSEMENSLLAILRKVWNLELSSGKYKVVTWNKYGVEPKEQLVTFATLGSEDQMESFCHLTDGMELQITYDSIIGACPKDGATLIEKADKENEYTIGKIGNYVINSYNHATKMITPKQVMEKVDHGYPSNHNELILDTRLIEKIRPYHLS